MQVSNYQMHNALECYSKKLSRARTRTIGKSADGGPQKAGSESLWSQESSRKVTMEKISRQVLNKVTDVAVLSRSQEVALPEPPGPEEDAPGVDESPETVFTFNVIDSVNRKRISHLPVGDLAALVRRLDPARERASTGKTESWV